MKFWIITGVAAAVILAGFAWRVFASGRDPEGRRVGRARDDRGRDVKLIDPVPLFALGRHDVIDEEALTKIVEQLEPGSSKRRGLLLVGLIVGGLAVLGVASMVLLEGQSAMDDLVSTITNPAILACVVGGGIAPWLATRRERQLRLRSVMLQHRRCPHCGYGLTGVPAGEDGLTVCPECACAWRIDASACADPGPVSPPKPKVLLVLLALGVAAFLAGLAVFMFMR
jgi:hypothetical protein